MAYIRLAVGEIDTSVTYLTKDEFMKRTGIPSTTLHRYVKTDKIDALQFGRRTYFHPSYAAEYEALAKSGLSQG